MLTLRAFKQNSTKGECPSLYAANFPETLIHSVFDANLADSIFCVIDKKSGYPFFRSD